MTRLLAFTGPAGSGKSTAAKHLELFGYRRIRFAGPLKRMMRALGLSDEQIEGSLKDLPTDLLGGKTPRFAMQTLGTEWGRNLLGENFWVGIWERNAAWYLNGLLQRVVVDDCRFQNEAEAVHRLGGKIIRIVGRGGISGDHASERMDWSADEEIVNDGSVEDFYREVERFTQK